MVLKINVFLIRVLKVFLNSQNVTNTRHICVYFLVVLCKLKGCIFETKFQHLLIYTFLVYFPV